MRSHTISALFCLSRGTALMVVSCLWCLSPAFAPAAESDNDFRPIFNGKNLDGWEGEEGYWSVEDGAITGENSAEKPLKHHTYLFWKGGAPADFELHAEFRFLTPQGNSGIQFRSRRLLPGWDVQGYQADMEAGPTFTGILYECNGRGILTKRGQKLLIHEDGRREVSTFADAAALQKLIKPNDWNRYVIIARGAEIILKVNGEMTTWVIDRERGKAAAEGQIALQLHAGPPMKVQFRNLRLKIIRETNEKSKEK